MSIVVGLSCIGGLVAAFLLLKTFYYIEEKKEALLAEVAELKRKLRAIEDAQNHTLNQVRSYYDQCVEGNEKELEGSKAFGEALKTLAIFFARELERLEPGWFERRLAANKGASDHKELET